MKGLKLKVLEGKYAGKEIAVAGDKFLIGRAEDCHLRAGSDLISRHHCIVMVDNAYVAIRDFGSKNGTFVNGERIAGERELKVGDCVKVGPLVFEVHWSHGLGGAKKPPVADVKEAAARTARASESSNIDVDRWLTPEHSPGQVSPTAETQRIALSEAESTKINTTQVYIPPEALESENPSDTSSTTAESKPEPSPITRFNQVSGKDSQEAAAKMLEKFRRRR